MGLYMFYMNKTPLVPEGKVAAGKLPVVGEEHIVSVQPVTLTEMAVPMSCKAEAAMTHHSPAVNMV
jgi:solute carrier family 50 protein (sugar transporter)